MSHVDASGWTKLGFIQYFVHLHAVAFAVIQRLSVSTTLQDKFSLDIEISGIIPVDILEDLDIIKVSGLTRKCLFMELENGSFVVTD
jgi:hypothetical protein